MTANNATMRRDALDYLDAERLENERRDAEFDPADVPGAAWPCGHQVAGADLHSCYPDGSSVTLWPRGVITTHTDGHSSRATLDNPDEARAYFEQVRRRLAAEQR